MRPIVLDDRGKTPRFVIFQDAVVNQKEGGKEPYTTDWLPAYIKLYKKWKDNEQHLGYQRHAPKPC